jgi:hypothetical protein
MPMTATDLTGFTTPSKEFGISPPNSFWEKNEGNSNLRRLELPSGCLLHDPDELESLGEWGDDL